MITVELLPARFAYTRDHAFVGKLTEADTAQAEITHEATTTATFKTAIFRSAGKLWFPRCAEFCRCFCHILTTD
jgi:hypothetical protein